MIADFAVEISQNTYLAEGGGDVDAIVTVTASGPQVHQDGPDEEVRRHADMS